MSEIVWGRRTKNSKSRTSEGFFEKNRRGGVLKGVSKALVNELTKVGSEKLGTTELRRPLRMTKNRGSESHDKPLSEGDGQKKFKRSGLYLERPNCIGERQQ